MDRRQKIEQRLEAGECPVKMSIEHWEHNREIVENGKTLTFEDTSSDSCALCVYNDMHDSDCSHCALALATGSQCYYTTSPWAKVREIMHRYSGIRGMLLPAIDEMLEALHKAELLEMEDEVPNW